MRKIIVSLYRCCQSQNYKIWKQFTTKEGEGVGILSLLSITKLQNLKAIHNSKYRPKFDTPVVVNHKTTKFESNSQPTSCNTSLRLGCCQSQNYKIWKQFTTVVKIYDCKTSLLSITKLQNLKAIHNCNGYIPLFLFVVVNHKTTKFESNSQLFFIFDKFSVSCCQSQNYKIWKQFTTQALTDSEAEQLLSITKLQNLKAIHNGIGLPCGASWVVVNHKTTKFESNSQRTITLGSVPWSCCQSQNYKIWKQFTTRPIIVQPTYLLLSITKLQNLKAIHNILTTQFSACWVVVNHKTTKFESNSQQSQSKLGIKLSCCQSQNYKIWKQFTTTSRASTQITRLLSITKLQNLKAIHNIYKVCKRVW